MGSEMQIGPYELRGELGRGAMARVWRAWDASLRREVAIKEPLFDPRLPQETLDEMARRFVAEGRAVARLSHPNIVAVYATDVWDGRPAIVMELVEGVTLTHLLAAGPLPIDEALAILDQLLDAVSYAHWRGVIHRDIKPDNIFVTATGQAKLADFGVAHVEGEGVTRLTMAGSVLGTPGYMSPEQAQGKPIDGRSDLFSIGVVAYEMLTGENPFAAGSPDATTMIYRIVHEPVSDLQLRVPSAPDCVIQAVMAALEKAPDERPPSAEAFKRMLHGLGATDKVDYEAVPYETKPEHHGPIEGPETVLVSDSGTPYAGARKWLPYVLVGGACIIGLALALGSALSGGAGGSASPATTAVQERGDTKPDTQGTSETEVTTETTEDETGTTPHNVAGAEESQGFSQQNPPYTLTVDSKGVLCLYDASNRRMDDYNGFYLDVSYLPEKAVARLEQGVTYDTYDEAWSEYSSTDDDCLPPAILGRGLALHPDRVADEGPYWCIVIDVYDSLDTAERVAAASTEKFGVDVSVMPTLEWDGLFYEYLGDKRTNNGEGYCVVAGLAHTYQEVLQNYLTLSETMGQSLDAQVLESISSDSDNWKLLDKLDDIKYAGTRRYPG